MRLTLPTPSGGCLTRDDICCPSCGNDIFGEICVNRDRSVTLTCDNADCGRIFDMEYKDGDIVHAKNTLRFPESPRGTGLEEEEF